MGHNIGMNLAMDAGHVTGLVAAAPKLSAGPANLASEMLFGVVVEGAAHCMILADRAGRIVMVNAEAERLFGYLRDELLGGAIEMLIPARFRAGHADLRGDFHRQPTTRPMGAGRNLFGLRKNGDEVPIEIGLNPIVVGGERHVLATVVDITAREQAEAAQARLAAIVASSVDAIISKTLDGVITSWNAAAERIFGWPAAEIVGKSIKSIIPPDHWHEEEQIIARVRAGQRMEQYETIRMRRDGVPIPVSLTVSPIHDRRGLVIGASTILRDASGRQSAEAVLREANETLERRVAERTHELAGQMEARRKAEEALAQSQKLEAVGQLTGGVAHDFNNLLTVIAGNLYFIGEQAEGNDRLRRHVTSSQRAVERGARLTGQLLAFARRQTLMPEIVRLDDVIRDFSNLMRRAVGETVEVAVQSQIGLWSCEIDPSQFESAVLNLAINARDAMPDGGKLVIALRNHVSESGSDVPAGRYVSVSVTDTGTGMPAEVAARAVEPFFTTKEVGRGSGLGLSQVYGFAQQSGGSLRIHSRPGDGTRVTMLFPAETTTPLFDDQPPAPDVAASRATVLVVEDDEDVLELVEEALRLSGHRVITAHDGREALALFDQHPDLQIVVSDVVMPNGTSGVDLVREVLRRRPSVAVLLMSGYPRDELSRIGGTDNFPFLAKPFRPSDLAACMLRLQQAEA